MNNTNGKKYGFTGLFPIKENADGAALRDRLRRLDEHPRGSPLSAVDLIHMVRLVVLDQLPFQGSPAAFDQLRSRYLLFVCDFDGESVDVLVRALVAKTPDLVTAIWEYCIGFPGLSPSADGDPQRLVDYFRQCQIRTNLFLADQPERTVPEILRGIEIKRRFADFLERHQGEPPDRLQQSFHDMWQSLRNAAPQPGSL